MLLDQQQKQSNLVIKTRQTTAMEYQHSLNGNADRMPETTSTASRAQPPTLKLRFNSPSGSKKEFLSPTKSIPDKYFQFSYTAFKKSTHTQKLFRQLSNKENQQESASKPQLITKNSIKRVTTPLKIEFENEFPRKMHAITPFDLPEHTCTRGKDDPPRSSEEIGSKIQYQTQIKTPCESLKCPPLARQEPVYQPGSFQEEVQSYWHHQLQSPPSQQQYSTPESPQEPKLQHFSKGKRLGKGMFGEVFVVQHLLTGFLCAMKVISKEFARQQKVTNQLVQQLKIHMSLTHPNVVSVYGYFHDQNNIYILQELCVSGQLYDILGRRRRISERKTGYYISQMVEAVSYIHNQKVIHRDIKPENILIQYGVVKVADFGWAEYSPTNDHSGKCGTPLYYSPEVIRGDRYSRVADLWGIGLICFQLIVGNVPWSIWTEQQISRIAEEALQFPSFLEVSMWAQDFIERVLTKYPNNRMTLSDMLKHPFLADSNCFAYHNESSGSYGEVTP